MSNQTYPEWPDDGDEPFAYCPTHGALAVEELHGIDPDVTCTYCGDFVEWRDAFEAFLGEELHRA